ncbi:hypothetical protein N9N28_05065 [Rubripirellula amarantea]|nr:hypothetical protein [Rubripirellula amarantea]
MFDPLHKWLGIPPSEQPPHHYRLLGVTLFESDPDVIDSAADRQLSFLHELTGGEHSEAAEQLSNQVSLARLCLLNADKKAAYDEVLRRRRSKESSSELGPQPAAALQPTIPVNQLAAKQGTTGHPTGAAPTAPVLRPGPVEPKSPVRVQSRIAANAKRRRKTSSPFWMISAIAGIIAILMIFMAVREGHLKLDYSWITGTADPEGPSPATQPSVAETDSAPSTVPSMASNTPVVAAAPTSRQPSGQPNNRPTQSQRSTDRDDADNNRESSGAKAPVPKPRSLADLLKPPSPELVAAKPSIVRSPLPSAAELNEKLEVVNEVYENELRGATKSDDPEVKIATARQLFRDGEQTSKDPVGRFAMWRYSRDLFTQAGSVADALATSDVISRFYEGYDRLSENLDVIRNLVSSDREWQSPADLVETVEAFVDEANQANRYELSVAAASAVLDSIGDGWSIKDRDLLNDLKKEASEADTQYSAFRDAVKAWSSSKRGTPKNQAASGEIGRFLVVARGDWDEAKLYFSMGDNRLLARAAELDLKQSQSDTAQREVADAWVMAVEGSRDAELREAVLNRAVSLIEAAISNLEGLEKGIAERRLREVTKLLEDHRAHFPATSFVESQPTTFRSPGRILDNRRWTSTASRSDSAKSVRQRLEVGMGSHPRGLGAAAAGVELAGVETLAIDGQASPPVMETIDSDSKFGLLIDYHTPGGYTKRVFVGFATKPDRTFSLGPPWGKEQDKPDIEDSLPPSNHYDLDLNRWAPDTWDRRCWVTLFMQNCGYGRQAEASLSW